MKIIYLNETIQWIAATDVEAANEIIQSGEVRFIKEGEEAVPYVVIEDKTELETI